MAVTGQQIISVRNGKMRVSVLHVPAGKANDPISKFLHRLCAPLRWSSRSIGASGGISSITSYPGRL